MMTRKNLLWTLRLTLVLLFVFCWVWAFVSWNTNLEAHEEQAKQRALVTVFDLGKYPATPAEWKNAEAIVLSRTERSRMDAIRSWKEFKIAEKESVQVNNIQLTSASLNEVRKLITVREKVESGLQEAENVHRIDYRGIERECSVLNESVWIPERQAGLPLLRSKIHEPQACVEYYTGTCQDSTYGNFCSKGYD